MNWHYYKRVVKGGIVGTGEFTQAWSPWGWWFAVPPMPINELEAIDSEIRSFLDIWNVTIGQHQVIRGLYNSYTNRWVEIVWVAQYLDPWAK